MNFVTVLLLLLPPSSSAQPQHSPALNQLQAIDAGGPRAFGQAADNCPPASCAQGSAIPAPSWTQRRYGSGLIDSGSPARVDASPSNINTININNLGPNKEKGGERSGTRRLLGGGLGGVLGFLIALAMPACFPLFGTIALVAVGALAGSAAFAK